MLLKRAIAATIWSGADVLIRQGIQFAVAVTLARLLTPEDFGTIALLYLFTGVATVFADSGFSSALVQRQDITHTDESTVFWINLALGASMSAALIASASAFARLYSQPVLAPLTIVLALSVFLSALGSIHATLLTKKLDFRTPMKVNLVAASLAGVVAILLARRGFGVWALALQTLAATGTTTALYWMLNRWRPRAVFSLGAARRLFGFGGFVLTSSLLDTAYSRIYTLLIGRFYGVRPLGFYSRADGTKGVAADALTGILARVAFPVFSAAAHDSGRLRRGVRMALRGIMLVNIPAMLGLAALADPFIVTLFGAPWRPAVPILRVLCLAGALWPLHVVNLNVLLAQGHSSLYFRVEIAKKAVGILLLAIGCWFGIMGIAWSQVIFGVVAFVINAYYTRRFLGYGATHQVRDCLPILGSAAPMAAGVYWLSRNLGLVPWTALLGLAPLGAAVYLFLGWSFRLAALHDAVALVRGRAPEARPA